MPNPDDADGPEPEPTLPEMPALDDNPLRPRSYTPSQFDLSGLEDRTVGEFNLGGGAAGPAPGPEPIPLEPVPAATPNQAPSGGGCLGVALFAAGFAGVAAHLLRQVGF